MVFMLSRIKLPTVITPTTAAIDTIAGFWIKPTETCTYVVRQEVCGNVKWDTVVIHMNPLGVVRLSVVEGDLELFPNPAQDFIELKVPKMDLLKDFKSILIYNSLGSLVREEVLRPFDPSTSSGLRAQHPDSIFKIKINDLSEGVYFLELSGSQGTARKRFVVAR